VLPEGIDLEVPVIGAIPARSGCAQMPLDSSPDGSKARGLLRLLPPIR